MFESESIQSLLESLFTVIVPRALGVLTLLFVAWIVAKWVGKRVRSGVSKRLDASIAGFAGNMAKYAILTVAVIGCLRIFGIETTSFVAIIGAAGLAVGLALQGTLSNFAAGVMLLVLRPFKVGDAINAGGVTAKVVEIGLFTTQMDTPDNRRMIVPNSAINGSRIENITFHEKRRVDVAVGTEYSADLAQTRDILIAAVSDLDGVLPEPAPAAVLNELGGSSIDWSVRVWAQTSDYWAVREKATQAVKNALDEAGIGIPFPQMDVHIDGMEVLDD